jgi:hypothetical protein
LIEERNKGLEIRIDDEGGSDKPRGVTSAPQTAGLSIFHFLRLFSLVEEEGRRLLAVF